MAGEITTIRKSFSEMLKEIEELEKQKTEVIPKYAEEETGEIEFLSMDFSEALSELRRLYLIKRLSKKWF